MHQGAHLLSHELMARSASTYLCRAPGEPVSRPTRCSSSLHSIAHGAEAQKEEVTGPRAPF